jgi:hypothetical protein
MIKRTFKLLFQKRGWKVYLVQRYGYNVRLYINERQGKQVYKVDVSVSDGRKFENYSLLSCIAWAEIAQSV